MAKCISCAFFILTCFVLQAQERQFKAYAVGFYNVENLFDTVDNNMIRDEEFTPDGKKVWTHDKYTDKIANLASVISQLGLSLCPEGISLLGISEIENDTVIIDLINHPLLRSRNYGIVHHSSPDGRGIDVALIYDKDVFNPLSVKPYKVDIQSLGSSRPTRDVLLVSGELDGELIHLTVNHWPSRSGGEKRTAKFRNKAAEVNRYILDSLLLDDPKAKFIVLGDLNDDTNNESLTKYLRAKFKPKAVGPDDMYNPMHALFQKGYGTTAWRDRWSLFDQLVLSHAWLDKEQDDLHFHQAVIFNKKYLIQKWGKYKGYPFRTFDGDEYQGGYSDHFPVLVYLLKSI
ncbi:MAG: endonuclease/exonuclease/phosphatase family protein [Saprospiraceae bacterium]|nr:endonuclease/exonuclease/phosphatase family protein [Saprospiraceae bacterium]